MSTATPTKRELPEMAVSFLQYCATCERQIYTPSSTILYCSEACRRTDSSKPVSSAMITPPTSPLPSASCSRPILPNRFPTGSGAISSRRIPTRGHSTSSDLDPTEWKPKLPSGGSSTNSEAVRYLSSFHQWTSNADGNLEGRANRPALQSGYASTASIISLNPANTPSLAQSPTTASSSLSANVEYFTPVYDFNTRPLPPRHDPSYSSSANTTRGIDLVLPHAARTSDGTMAGSAPSCFPLQDKVWAKQYVQTSPKVAAPATKDGLAALFRVAVQ